MRIHDLKIGPQYFNAVAQGIKKAEFRFHDREYQKGDILILRETGKDPAKFTGSWIMADVTDVTDLSNFIHDPYVMISINPFRYFNGETVVIL